MIFHPRQKKVSVNVPLTLENTVIKQVTDTKFLGILIDQHLSWNPHNDFASKKNLEKCGNYCESPLLPIIPNFDDLVLLPCISVLSLLLQPNASVKSTCAQPPPPKISPSKRVFEKYKPRGLFSEFYGICICQRIYYKTEESGME